jgi:hypothetical protein
MLTEQDIRGELSRLRGHASRILRGVERPACAHCSSERYVAAHHDSYFAPREVIWLCGSCHARRHINLRIVGLDPATLYIDGRLGGAPPPREAGMPREDYNEHLYIAARARREGVPLEVMRERRRIERPALDAWYARAHQAFLDQRAKRSSTPVR